MFVSSSFWNLVEFVGCLDSNPRDLGIQVWPNVHFKNSVGSFSSVWGGCPHQTTIFQLAIDLYEFILPQTLSARHSYVISMVFGYYINRWDSFPDCTKLQDIDRWWPKPNATYFLVPPPLAVTTNGFFLYRILICKPFKCYCCWDGGCIPKHTFLGGEDPATIMRFTMALHVFFSAREQTLVRSHCTG